MHPITKLTIAGISLAALLLMSRMHFNDVADRLYPFLSKVLPLENSIIESSKYQKLLKKYRENYNASDSADYLFFGDSHIQYFNVDAYFANSRIANYGIASDTTEGVIKRLPHPNSRHTIKKGVLFMVGYNDLKYRDVPSIVRNYRRLLVATSRQLDIPFSKIAFQSLFPVSRERAYINDSILSINQSIKSLCAESGCVFLDFYPNFTGSAGGLNDSYSKDGVHLNKSGYDIWADLLKQSLNI